MGFHVSKSGIELKLLCEQLAEGELRRSSFKGVRGRNRKGEGETGEEGKTRQRQTNESADESLLCAAGRSREG